MIRTATALLVLLPCFAEDSRRFPFLAPISQPEMTEIASIVRAICESRTATLETSPPALVLSGNEDMFAAAAWLIEELSRPSKGTRQYTLRGVPDGAIRILFLEAPDQPTQNELAAAVRGITETRRLLISTRAKAIVLRGTGDQAAAASWLVETLTSPTRHSREFRPDPALDETIRVVFPPESISIPELNEAAAAIRAVADVRKLMTFSAARAIAFGAPAEQAVLAAWLARSLATTPTPGAEPLRYRYPDPVDNDTEVRVFSVAPANGIEGIAGTLRRQTHSRRILWLTGPNAIFFRGTPAQAALAEQLVKEATR